MHEERPSVFFSMNKYMIQIEPLEAKYNCFVFCFAPLCTYGSIPLYSMYHSTQFQCWHLKILFPLLWGGYKMTIQGLIQTSALHLSVEKEFVIEKYNFWYALTSRPLNVQVLFLLDRSLLMSSQVEDIAVSSMPSALAVEMERLFFHGLSNQIKVERLEVTPNWFTLKEGKQVSGK